MGLISVKDRDSLFDLSSSLQMTTTTTPTTSFAQQQQAANENKQKAGNNNNVAERRLVFIEAEQMLVLNTDLGWRPVQLLPALRDFRKAIAKYSLSSAEDRRRLVQFSGGSSEVTDNSIKPLKRHNGNNNNNDNNDKEVPIPFLSGNQLDPATRVAPDGSSKRRYKTTTNDILGGVNDDEEDDDDYDDDDDDDDDGDDDDDDDDEDNDVDLDDQDDDIDSDDGNKLASGASKRLKQPARKLTSSVSGRSGVGSFAAVALVTESIDESIGSTLGAYKELIDDQKQPKVSRSSQYSKRPGSSSSSGSGSQEAAASDSDQRMMKVSRRRVIVSATFSELCRPLSCHWRNIPLIAISFHLSSSLSLTHTHHWTDDSSDWQHSMHLFRAMCMESEVSSVRQQ